MSAYSDAVLADSPYLYYRLGESSGLTATDSSGNARDGTYSATGITYSEPGLIANDADTCIQADGSTGIITTPVPVSTIQAPYTVEAWISNDFVTARYVADARGPTTADTQFNIQMASSNQLNVNLGGASGLLLSHAFTPVAFQGRNHLVVVALTGSCKFYLNGALFTASFSGTPVLWQSGFIQSLTFAARNSAGTLSGQYFGRLDEFAVYTAELTADRVTAHYQAGFPVPKRPTATVNQAVSRASVW